MTYARDTPEPWLWVPAEPSPQIYTPVWVSPTSYLIPMRSGAVLRWVYDESDVLTFSMLVRLTEEETQRVFDSDPTTGMLEAVRPTLRWQGALMTLSHELGEPYPNWRYFIEHDTSEQEFIHDMMTPPFGIVEEAIMAAERRRSITPEQRRARMSEEQQRDSDFAAPLLNLLVA